MIVESKRLTLEPLTRKHAEPLFRALRQKEIYRFIPQDPPASVDELVKRYQFLEARKSPDGAEHWLNWAVRLKSDNSYIGRFESTVRLDRTALFAYVFGRFSWGQGFATEAGQQVIEHLFNTYCVGRLIAEVDTRNTASMRLLERLGFQRGAIKQNADFFKGLASHEFVYSLTRPDAHSLKKR